MRRRGRRSTNRHRPRGVITLVAAVLLLTVVVLALNIGLIRVTSDMTDSSLLADGIEALSLAESSVERAAQRLNLGGATACTAVGLNAGQLFNLGRGTFTVLSTPAPAIVSTVCRFQVRGTVGKVERTLQVDLQPGATPLFQEYFAGSIAGWTQVLTNTGGNSTYDNNSNCPNTICTNTLNNATGSFRAFTNATTGNERLTGFRVRTLPTNISTGPAGLTITVDFGYVKHSANGNPRAAQIGVALQETGGAAIVVWTDPSPTTAAFCASPIPPAAAGCWTSNPQTITLPASRTYNRILLAFDLHERGGNLVSAWFDAVTITDGSGTVAVVRWAEI